MNDDKSLAEGLLKYASQKTLQQELAECPTSPETSQGNRLKRIMQTQGLTPTALALKTNNKVRVSKIIAALGGSKKHELSGSDLKRVCQALGVSFDYFVKPVEVSINDMPEWESLGHVLMRFPYEQRVRVITSIRNSLDRHLKGSY